MRKRSERRKALWTLLWRAGRWRLVVVLSLAILQGLMPTAAILASGLLVSVDRALLGLVWFGAALLLAAVLQALVDYHVQVLDGRYGRTVHQTIARATLTPDGVAVLEDPEVAGELAALRQFERADGFVGTATALRELVQRRATGVGAFVVLFAFAWWAPVLMLAGWRALSYGVRQWLERGMELGSEVAAAQLGRASYLRSLAVDRPAAKEVRIFGLAGWLVSGYADTYRAALEAIWAGRRLGMRTVLGATTGVAAAHAIVLGTLAWQASTGALSLAQLVVYAQAVLGSSALGYVFGAEAPLARARQVAWQALRLLRRTAPAAARTRPEIETRPGPLEIRLTRVRFTYPSRSEPTLSGLCLAIPAGQSLAIVGENGTGKSTLIKLLCGLYEPDAGQITVGRQAPVLMRQRIGVIFQNFVRYELSLRANVQFGNSNGNGDGSDDAGIARALSDAGAGELAAGLPAGLDTVLAAGYAGGQDLSGGQWQKVALARALAAIHGGAGLLILDEPTASLDVRAEAELFDRLLAFRKGVTTILVSHRLASVRHADRIVVIAGGRIAEDGTHDELVASRGRYAAMFALQASRFAEPVVNGASHG